MIYLSASSIKDFISCERKYWYRRFASDVAEPTEAIARGSAVHKVIEKYWDDPDKGFEFLNSFSKREFDLVKAQKAMDSFYANFRNLLGEGELIEHKFKIDFGKGVKLIGVFDRVLPTGVIFDWKTNRSLPYKACKRFIMGHSASGEVPIREPVYMSITVKDHLQSRWWLPSQKAFKG